MSDRCVFNAAVMRPLAGLAALLLVAAGPASAQQKAPGPAIPQQKGSAPASPPPPSVTGIWYDDTGRGAVEVYNCGEKLCGRVHWLQESHDFKSGVAITDLYNPEASKRNRPVCGIMVIGGVQRMTDGSWDNGWVYDPKEGKSYDVEVKLKSPNVLAVTGYIGTKFLSRTLIWTRAPADLPRCSTTAVPPGTAVNNVPTPPLQSAPPPVNRLGAQR